MEKVFKALDDLESCAEGIEVESYYNVLYQALIELKAIKETNPSKALKGLEFICKILKDKDIDIKWLFKEDYNTIKQALIQAQENEKALEIVKSNLRLIGNCLQARAPFVKKIEGDQESDSWVFVKEITDVEELNILKRWLKK